jgi:16S rRNA (cytidine1402-2'-O)-methyltransferase
VVSYFEVNEASRTASLVDALGDDRPAAVCRELTKTHEEVRRGPLAELVAWAADGVRGEVTIVVAGASGGPDLATDPDSLRAAVAKEEAAGATRKEAIVDVARRAGLPKREVYDVVHR